MSDFINNGYLPSTLLPSLIRDIPLAQSIMMNTGDNIFSSIDESSVVGYVGNYEDIFSFTVKYAYNTGLNIFTKVSESFGSNLPDILKFDKLYTSSLYDIIIRDNYVYSDNEIVSITTSQKVTNLNIIGMVKLEDVVFIKQFNPETITIVYLDSNRYSVYGSKSGYIGTCQNQIRFSSDYISFTLNSTSSYPRDEFIQFDIAYDYDIDIKYINSFIISNIKSIYNYDTINPDRLLFYTPESRLNNIIPLFKYDTNYVTFDRMLDNCAQLNVDVNNLDFWGASKGHILSLPINNDKFVNYNNYYWVGHLLPSIYSTPKNVGPCSWVDVNTERGIIKQTINNMQAFWGMLYSPYLVSNSTIFSTNKIKVNISTFNFDIDSNSDIINADNLYFFYIDANNQPIQLNYVYSYNYKNIKIDQGDTKSYITGKLIPDGLEFKLFNLPTGITNIYTIFNTGNKTTPHRGTAYKADIPQYYCITRSDTSNNLSPIYYDVNDADWAIDNYWISGNDIYKHSVLFNYNIENAIRAETPIIEFKADIVLNSTYNELNNKSCDPLYRYAKKYKQIKTISNQAPLFDTYLITDEYNIATCLFEYTNNLIIGKADADIADINFSYPVSIGELCYSKVGEIIPFWNIEINSSPIYAIANENNEIEATQDIPSTNGAWTTPLPLLSNLQRNQLSTLSYNDYYPNARSLLYSGDTRGSLIQYNTGYEYLVASQMANINFQNVIKNSQITYNNLLQSPIQFCTKYLINYLNQNDTMIVNADGSINYTTIFSIFKQNYIPSIFRNVTEYKNFCDIVYTIPALQLKAPVAPEMYYNNIVNMTVIKCHDEHLQPYVILDTNDKKQIVINSVADYNDIVTIGLYNSSFPIDIKKNQVWFDQNSNQMYIFNVITDMAYAAAYPPSDSKYDVWINLASNTLYRFDGTKWVQIYDEGKYYSPNTNTTYTYNNTLLNGSNGKFTSLTLINFEALINQIVMSIEQEYYVTCSPFDNKDSIIIDIDNADQFLASMSDCFLAYKNANNINPTYTGFDPGNAFTWNYSSATWNVPIKDVYYKWYTLYQVLYNTTSPNTEPWKIIKYTQEQLEKEMELLGITMFTIPMWNYIKSIANIPLSVNFSNNALLPPYVNSTVDYAIEALTNIIPESSSSTIPFGGSSDIEYAWRNSIAFSYDEILTLYNLNPLAVLKNTLGYKVYNKDFNNTKFEYCPFVNRKLPSSDFLQYNESNTFYQDYKAVATSSNSVNFYSVTTSQGYPANGMLFVKNRAAYNNASVLLGHNGRMYILPWRSKELVSTTPSYYRVTSTNMPTNGVIIAQKSAPAGSACMFLGDNGSLYDYIIDASDTLEELDEIFIDNYQNGIILYTKLMNSGALYLDNTGYAENITVTTPIFYNDLPSTSLDDVITEVQLEFFDDIIIDGKVKPLCQVYADGNLINMCYIDFDEKVRSNIHYLVQNNLNVFFNIKQPTYFYHRGSKFIINNKSITFSYATSFRPVGMLQWIHTYNLDYALNLTTYSNKFKNWSMEAGFRTTGPVDSNDLSITYNGTNVSDFNYKIIGINDSSRGIMRINSVQIGIAKIGKALSGTTRGNFVPLTDGSDWVFTIKSADPVAQILSFYDLSASSTYTTINPLRNTNVEFNLFETYTDIVQTKDVLIAIGVQALINVIYGMHLYYQDMKVRFNSGTYFEFMQQFINLLYTEGFEPGDLFNLNPLNQGFEIDQAYGIVDKVSDFPTQSNTYLYDSSNIKLDLSQYSILRRQNLTSVTGTDLANANLVYNIYDTVILFKNSSTTTLVDFTRGIYPKIIYVKLTRSAFTGRPSFPGKLLKADGTLIDNVLTQVVDSEKAYNAYSNDNIFSKLRFDLFQYTNGVAALKDLLLTESEIFRMMRDALKDQGTTQSITNIINSPLFKEEYTINESYIIFDNLIENTSDNYSLNVFEDTIIDVTRT